MAVNLPPMRRCLLAAVLALIALVAAVPASGLGKFHQQPGQVSCYGRFDPITVHNSRQPSEHEHLFVGSTAICGAGNAANYSDLAGRGTDLDNPDDTAAYWVPTLHLTTGWRSTTDLGLASFRNYYAYYRCWNHANTCPGGDSRAYPPDTRLVVGDPHQPSGVALNTAIINWSCDERSSRGQTSYPDIQTANCAAATGTVYLTLHVDFPSCWNGKDPAHTASESGDTRDNADFAFTVDHNRRCPPGFPIHITELRETFKWGNGTGSYWKGKYPALSTDILQRMAGNPVRSGQTAHADFWNTWKQTGGVHGGFNGMVAQCVNVAVPAAFCNAG